MIPVSIACRRSTKKQDESHEDQERVCRDAIARLGERVVVKVYYYTVSASRRGKLERDPTFRSIFSDAKAGAWQEVWFFEFSRFCRRGAQKFIRWVDELEDDFKVKIDSATEDVPEDRMARMYWMMGVAEGARQEAKKIGLRFNHKRLSVAMKGRPVSVPAYGFTYPSRDANIPVIVEREAEVIRIAARMYRDHGDVVICRTLNQAGYRTRRGKPWRPTSLHVVFRNPAICGKPAYNKTRSASEFWKIEDGAVVERDDGERRVFEFLDESAWIYLPVSWPAIISAEDYATIQRIRAERAAKHANGSERCGYLLHGLRCSACGMPVVGHRRKMRKGRCHTIRYYQHVQKGTDCPGGSVRADKLERAIVERVCHDVLLGGSRPELEALVRERLSRHAGERPDTSIQDARVREIDGKVRAIGECLSPENARLLDSQLTELRRERERIEADIAQARAASPVLNLDRAVSDCVDMLLRLYEALRTPEDRAQAGRLLRDIVTGGIVHFSPRVAGKRKETFEKAEFVVVPVGSPVQDTLRDSCSGAYP